ncbi:MAG: tyrosine-type recombinase/integrase [Helicobacteraceae bacterium]|nr:tyrosine-type recombinase/integrase [Helicobacteraceae bacterium]
MKNLIQQNRVAFLDYLGNIKGYSDLTLKSYDEAIKQMIVETVVNVEERIPYIDLMPLRLKIASLNAKTISKKLSAIRTFITFLHSKNIDIELRNDTTIKVAKTLPKPISFKKIEEALLLATIQERIYVELIYTLGLRISELSSLRLESISEGWITIVGKGQKERSIPLLVESQKLIEEYKKEFQPKEYLFEKKGQKLSENTLRYAINKLFKKIGVKVTPHQLRHSYATDLLNSGARIADVSELLGHSSMATTQIYTKLGSALKLNNYKSSHPLCKEDVENT